MKTIFILIGPKGSGKSYIGKLIEKNLSIYFMPVEPLFMKIKGSRDNIDESYIKEGFKLLESEIHHFLIKEDNVIIEQTGTADYFNQFLENLESKFRVKLIKIYAPLDMCNKRIKKRDSKIQIPVSQDLIDKINTKSISIKLNFALTIDNSRLSDKEIIESFKTILKKGDNHY
jgi:shikimate kinase